MSTRTLTHALHTYEICPHRDGPEVRAAIVRETQRAEVRARRSRRKEVSSLLPQAWYTKRRTPGLVMGYREQLDRLSPEQRDTLKATGRSA